MSILTDDDKKFIISRSQFWNVCNDDSDEAALRGFLICELSTQYERLGAATILQALRFMAEHSGD